MIQHYILVASSISLEQRIISSSDVIKARLEKGYWPLQERTKHRKRFHPGDKAVFYAANRSKLFTAAADISSTALPIGYRERAREECEFDHIFGAPYAIKLSNPHYFDAPVPVKNILVQLSVVKNTAFWWVYFQGGALRINENDYLLIVKRGISVR